MRVAVTVTDDAGRVFHGQANLTPAAAHRAGSKGKTAAKASKRPHGLSLDFSSPIRAFVKRHGSRMGGAQKFTLLLAALTKGDGNSEVPLQTIQKQWKKMKSLLGKWNGAHTIRAKEHGWVDSRKTGMYVLLPGWETIFDA